MVDIVQPDNLAQIADIVSRRKISDRRLRNEAIRQGSTDQSGFSQDYAPEIQQAAQPEQYRQAGNPLNDAIYGIPEGYTQQDLGNGTYNILDQSGGNIGLGYKDLNSSLSDLYKTNLVKSVKPYDTYDESGNINPTQSWNFGNTTDNFSQANFLHPDSPVNGDTGGGYSTQDAAIQAAKSQPINPILGQRGTMDQWEALGQLLNGGLPVPHEWGGLSSNGKDENISGLNTLFGSTPVFKNGQLIGYRTDISPGEDVTGSGSGGQDTVRGTGMGTFLDHNGKSHAWSNNIWRELNKGDWSGVSQLDQNGNVFIPMNRASTLPGWTNKDSYQHVDKEYNDGTGSIMSALGTILSFTPLAPIGMALSAGGALANNNPIGALTSMFGGDLGLGGTIGDMTGWAPDIANAVGKGVVGAGSTALQGGNLKQSLLSGLGSGLGSYAGGQLTSSLSPEMGQAIAKMFGGAASGGIQSLFTKNNPIAGSLYGGMSGGLNALLNSQDITDPNKDRGNISPQTLKQIFRK